MRTGVVEANLVHLLDENPRFPYVADLIDEKRSKGEWSTVCDLDLDRVETDVGALYEALEEAGVDSHLPSEPTAYPAFHDFVVRVRLGQLEMPARRDP